MKLYDFEMAPNPRRVRMFLAEKGIKVPTEQINTRTKEQFSEAFLKVNPRGTVPVLELDDGTTITESVSICRYFEDLHPEPALFGRDAKEKALVDMWNRRMEIEGYAPAGEVIRNSLEMFEDRAIAGIPNGVPQIPALAERGRASFARFLERLDARLGESQFIAGDQLSIADQTAFITLDFAKRGELNVPETAKNILRWQGEMAARPSASA
ncbi:MAG: glutathione S-transferase family protein [Hyphomicrobiaceae bacterium]